MIDRLDTIVALAALIGVATACSRKADNVPVPTCATYAECLKHDGKRVDVVGVYTLYYVPRPRLFKAKSRLPVVRIHFPDDVIHLAPRWAKEVRRSQAEMNKFEGKKVRVRGVFNKYIPRAPGDPPQAVGFNQPAMYPIESIAAVGELVDP